MNIKNKLIAGLFGAVALAMIAAFGVACGSVVDPSDEGTAVQSDAKNRVSGQEDQDPNDRPANGPKVEDPESEEKKKQDAVAALAQKSGKEADSLRKGRVETCAAIAFEPNCVNGILTAKLTREQPSKHGTSEKTCTWDEARNPKCNWVPSPESLEEEKVKAGTISTCEAITLPAVCSPAGGTVAFISGPSSCTWTEGAKPPCTENKGAPTPGRFDRCKDVKPVNAANCYSGMLSKTGKAMDCAMRAKTRTSLCDLAPNRELVPPLCEDRAQRFCEENDASLSSAQRCEATPAGDCIEWVATPVDTKKPTPDTSSASTPGPSTSAPPTPAPHATGGDAPDGEPGSGKVSFGGATTIPVRAVPPDDDGDDDDGDGDEKKEAAAPPDGDDGDDEEKKKGPTPPVVVKCLVNSAALSQACTKHPKFGNYLCKKVGKLGSRKLAINDDGLNRVTAHCTSIPDDKAGACGVGEMKFPGNDKKKSKHAVPSNDICMSSAESKAGAVATTGGTSGPGGGARGIAATNPAPATHKCVLKEEKALLALASAATAKPAFIKACVTEKMLGKALKVRGKCITSLGKHCGPLSVDGDAKGSRGCLNEATAPDTNYGLSNAELCRLVPLNPRSP